MVYRPPYPWYIEPLTHGILTLLLIEYLLSPEHSSTSTKISLEYKNLEQYSTIRFVFAKY